MQCPLTILLIYPFPLLNRTNNTPKDNTMAKVDTNEETKLTMQESMEKRLAQVEREKEALTHQVQDLTHTSTRLASEKEALAVENAALRNEIRQLEKKLRYNQGRRHRRRNARTDSLTSPLPGLNSHGKDEGAHHPRADGVPSLAPEVNPWTSTPVPYAPYLYYMVPSESACNQIAPMFSYTHSFESSDPQFHLGVQNGWNGHDGGGWFQVDSSQVHGGQMVRDEM